MFTLTKNIFVEYKPKYKILIRIVLFYNTLSHDMKELTGSQKTKKYNICMDLEEKTKVQATHKNS